jgi:hypothetical protein
LISGRLTPLALRGLPREASDDYNDYAAALFLLAFPDLEGSWFVYAD